MAHPICLLIDVKSIIEVAKRKMVRPPRIGRTRVSPISRRLLWLHGRCQSIPEYDLFDPFRARGRSIVSKKTENRDYKHQC